MIRYEARDFRAHGHWGRGVDRQAAFQLDVLADGVEVLPLQDVYTRRFVWNEVAAVDSQLNLSQSAASGFTTGSVDTSAELECVTPGYFQLAMQISS